MSSGERIIPQARVDDLDLDNPDDSAEWEERLQSLANHRIALARARLERMGIIDAAGQLVSDDLPPDMAATSEASVDTG